MKYRRRDGTFGQHEVKYELKMASFIFARTLHKTEDFCLASNLEDAGALDDLVFRYILIEPDVWKTCFIQV
jgi:hypothetical protein